MAMTATSQTAWLMPKHYGVWAAPSTSNPAIALPLQKNGPTLNTTFMDWFVAKVPFPKSQHLQLQKYIFSPELLQKYIFPPSSYISVML
jgi:hypothetical protein